MKYWVTKLDPRLLSLTKGSLHSAYMIGFIDSYLTWTKSDTYENTYLNISRLTNLDLVTVKDIIKTLEEANVVKDLKSVVKRSGSSVYTCVKFTYNREGVNNYIEKSLQEELVEKTVKELSR